MVHRSLKHERENRGVMKTFVCGHRETFSKWKIANSWLEKDTMYTFMNKYRIVIFLNLISARL